MQTFGSNPSSWKDEELNWIEPYAQAQILGLGEAVHTSSCRITKVGQPAEMR